LGQSEKQRNLRDQRPSVIDRLELWHSTGRNIDGLWVGTMEDEPRIGLRRVEEALQLIKNHAPLHYSRVLSNLERIWVRLLLSGLAQYDRSLKACVFDERYIVKETTTIERIASAIVHEAAHARLEAWGVGYDDEKKRARIEGICMRRERSFLTKLPQSESFQEDIARSLEWYGGNHDYFSNASFQQREVQGQIETLRYIGAPDWVFGFVMKLRAVRIWVQSLVRRGRWQA
jgi:hypothetical protein